jgi:methionyl-tRNA formyltransferase
LAAIVTQPDKPRGRHGTPSPSPAKVWALERGVPVLSPDRLKENTDFVKALAALEPDICVVAAYGKILTREILDVPRLGFINIHGSALPSYRGSAPIQRAIMEGAKRTGATIMQVEEAMDAGDIIRIAEIEIMPEDDYGSLSAKMASVGAEALIEALDDISEGRAVRVPQDESRVTYAPPITKEETEIDWSKSAVELFNLVRGLAPKPGAYTKHNGRRLKILKTKPAESGADAEPGVLTVSGERIEVGTGNGRLELLSVQPEGKRLMDASEFVRGHRPEGKFI